MVVNGCFSPKKSVFRITQNSINIPNYLYHAVNCGEDPLNPANTEVPPDEIEMMHGAVVLISCNDTCIDTRTCNDGTWIGNICPS